MKKRDDFQIEVLKLADGGRLLRLTEPDAGLALERRLDPKAPVVRQKNRLSDALEAAVARCESVAA